MIQIFRLSSFLLLCAALLVGSVAHAGSAQSFIEAKQRVLSSLIKKPKTDATDKKITETFDALLDYSAFAKNSLGKEWDGLSEAEQKDFQHLLTTLVRRSYKKNLRDTLDYNVEFKGQRQAKVGQLVSTVAKHKTDARKEVVHIDYLVRKEGGKWLVADIITEGESLVRNYKSQFRRVIKKKGFSGLIDKMRKKVEKG